MVQQQPVHLPEVNLPDHIKGEVYSNKVVVTHTKEEFVVDFIMVASSGSAVTSRVILNPAHMKRIVTQLHDDVVKYQDTFGKITPVEEPGK
jgi:hypothetical protein